MWGWLPLSLLPARRWALPESRGRAAGGGMNLHGGAWQGPCVPWGSASSRPCGPGEGAGPGHTAHTHAAAREAGGGPGRGGCRRLEPRRPMAGRVRVSRACSAPPAAPPRRGGRRERGALLGALRRRPCALVLDSSLQQGTCRRAQRRLRLAQRHCGSSAPPSLAPVCLVMISSVMGSRRAAHPCAPACQGSGGASPALKRGTGGCSAGLALPCRMLSTVQECIATYSLLEEEARCGSGMITFSGFIL